MRQRSACFTRPHVIKTLFPGGLRDCGFARLCLEFVGIKPVIHIWTRGVSLRGLTAVDAVDGVATERLLTVGKDGQSLHGVILGSAGLV